MDNTIGLADARKKLPELTDRAYAGKTYTITRRGRALAVILGVDEYERLKEIERQQRTRDFHTLLAPPGADALNEADARQIAVEAVRQARGKA